VRKFKRRRYATVALLCDDSICKEFNAEVKKLLSEGWTQEEGATSRWDMLRDCVLKVAKSVLGWGDSKQPDWFVESYLKLCSLIIKRKCIF